MGRLVGEEQNRIARGVSEVPTKRRYRLQAVITPASTEELAFLADRFDDVDSLTSFFCEYCEDRVCNFPGLRQLWRSHGALVLAEWIGARPGSRPRTWWRFDAPRMAAGVFPGCFYDGQLPSPRMFLAGAGCPDFEALNIVPHFELGRPDNWLGFDADDPPMFESQALYLDRHGLLRPRERRQLGPDAFEPETTQYEPGPLDYIYRGTDMQARIKAYTARATLNRQRAQESYVQLREQKGQ